MMFCIFPKNCKRLIKIKHECRNIKFPLQFKFQSLIKGDDSLHFNFYAEHMTKLRFTAYYDDLT